MVGMERESRMESLSAFQRREKRVLVSTEIGENGICFSGIDMVINFGFPTTGASYIKRAEKINAGVGTGKIIDISEKIIVVNFVKDGERGIANIIKVLMASKSPIDPLLTGKNMNSNASKSSAKAI